MPIMAIYRRDDVSAQLYNQYRAKVPLDAAPRGAVAHAYGRAGSGFVAVDIWDDRQAMDRYIEEKVRPACDELGVAFKAPEVIELETLVTTPAASNYPLAFEDAAQPEHA